MIIEYDETGKVIPSGDIGYHAERNQLEVETVPEGDFPISYIGEIYFDDLHKCVVDDREIRYWYEVQNGQLVKIGWPERYARGEFTLAQFKEKILVALKKNYQEKVSLTDADFLMYTKRITTELLEPQDFEQYQVALTTYAELTTKYRQDKSAVINCTDIEELAGYFDAPHESLAEENTPDLEL